MRLEQLVHDIIDMLEQGEHVNWDHYIKAEEDYRTELKTYSSAETLKKIAVNHLIELPVDLILETSRRLVEVDRSADNLRLLALYLDMHGPDWDDELAALRQEADELERSADNHSGT